jgi:hypothetical protein
MDPLAALHVVRSKPATHPFVLKVSLKAFGKFLVLGRIADEAAVILDRLI